jgi:hypothetical protein
MGTNGQFGFGIDSVYLQNGQFGVREDQLIVSPYMTKTELNPSK